ncbi:hypothetical protein MHYP_G00192290 [Metynnis hypsauchen]
MATEYLECHRCRKKVAGWSLDILEQLDPAHRAMFPAILTYRYSKRPMEHLDTTGQHLDTTPHWPPVISAAKKAKRQLFLEELERAQAAQAKQKPAPPTRGTLYRRKKTEEEDKKILQEAGRQLLQPDAVYRRKKAEEEDDKKILGGSWDSPSQSGSSWTPLQPLWTAKEA